MKSVIGQPYKPVVNGRASICNWEIEFSFLERKQIQKFIELLTNEDVVFDFSFYTLLDETHTKYCILVSGSWAYNMKLMAELAEQVDYNDEE
jgi:hypothetical protein